MQVVADFGTFRAERFPIVLQRGAKCFFGLREIAAFLQCLCDFAPGIGRNLAGANGRGTIQRGMLVFKCRRVIAAFALHLREIDQGLRIQRRIVAGFRAQLYRVLQRRFGALIVADIVIEISEQVG